MLAVACRPDVPQLIHLTKRNAEFVPTSILTSNTLLFKCRVERPPDSGLPLAVP
jgi:hypothetical protein